MLLLTAVMTVFVEDQRQMHPLVAWRVFVDDRIGWIDGNAEKAAEALAAAFKHAHTFDTDCSAVWNVGKGCLVATLEADRQRLRELDTGVGEVGTLVANLGIEYDVEYAELEETTVEQGASAIMPHLKME